MPTSKLDSRPEIESAELHQRNSLHGRHSTFVAQGQMKDMPAVLCAVLSVKSPGLMAEIFDRVIDNAKMLRNFVQLIPFRDVVGRK